MSAAHTLPHSPAVNSRRTKKQVSYTALFLPVPWLPWDALLGHTASLPPQSFAGGAVAGGREEAEKQRPGALLAPSWTNCRGSYQGQTHMSFWISKPPAWPTPSHTSQNHRETLCYFTCKLTMATAIASGGTLTLASIPHTGAGF